MHDFRALSTLYYHIFTVKSYKIPAKYAKITICLASFGFLILHVDSIFFLDSAFLLQIYRI